MTFITFIGKNRYIFYKTIYTFGAELMYRFYTFGQLKHWFIFIIFCNIFN